MASRQWVAPPPHAIPKSSGNGCDSAAPPASPKEPRRLLILRHACDASCALPRSSCRSHFLPHPAPTATAPQALDDGGSNRWPILHAAAKGGATTPFFELIQSKSVTHEVPQPAPSIAAAAATRYIEQLASTASSITISIQLYIPPAASNSPLLPPGRRVIVSDVTTTMMMMMLR